MKNATQMPAIGVVAHVVRVAEWLRVLSGLAEDLPETLDEQV